MAYYYGKDIKVIKWCRLCGVRWYSERTLPSNRRCICQGCRNKAVGQWRRDNPEKWLEIVRRYRRQARVRKPQWVLNEYERWKQWVKEHPEQRRAIARKSYYLRSKARATAVD